MKYCIQIKVSAKPTLTNYMTYIYLCAILKSASTIFCIARLPQFVETYNIYQQRLPIIFQQFLV